MQSQWVCVASYGHKVNAQCINGVHAAVRNVHSYSHQSVHIRIRCVQAITAKTTCSLNSVPAVLMASLVSIDHQLCWLIAVLLILLLLSQSSYCRGDTSPSFLYSAQDFEAEQVGDAFRQLTDHAGRHLSARSSQERADLIGGSGEDEEGEQNCTSPRQPGPEYNSSCKYVLAECRSQTKLVNYLSFVVCDLRVAQVHMHAAGSYKEAEPYRH